MWAAVPLAAVFFALGMDNFITAMMTAAALFVMAAQRLWAREKRAAGRTSARDLIDRTRARRAIGKHSASLFGWHNLRHTFVVLALQAGVPVNDVARIVGHGDVETTLTNYGNTSREVVAERTRRRMHGTVLAMGDAVPMIEGAAVEANAPAQLPAPAAKSTADRLRELKALADEGLITPEEYAEKRSALISEI